MRVRWAAVGAAVAVTLGAGGISLGQAAIGSGDKPVFVAIEPCRLVDTRPGDNNVGSRDTPLGAGDTLTLQVTGSTGRCAGIPAGATAAAMNVTAIQGSTRSYLTLYPADADLPLASNLNWNGGDPPTPNKVDVALSPGGAVKITNNAGTVHVAADLVGYYTDHTHDDRYYTKSQTGTVVQEIIDAQPWEIYISPNEIQQSGSTWPAVTFASGVDAIGLAYIGGEFGRAYYGFKLPDHYEAGTDVAVDMRYLAVSGFGAPVFPCNSVWWSNGPYIHRSGEEVAFAPTEWAIPNGFSTDETRLTSTNQLYVDNVISSTTMTIDGTALRPGDELALTLNRDGLDPNDTCEGMMVTGLLVRPAG